MVIYDFIAKIMILGKHAEDQVSFYIETVSVAQIWGRGKTTQTVKRSLKEKGKSDTNKNPSNRKSNPKERTSIHILVYILPEFSLSFSLSLCLSLSLSLSHTHTHSFKT